MRADTMLFYGCGFDGRTLGHYLHDTAGRAARPYNIGPFTLDLLDGGYAPHTDPPQNDAVAKVTQVDGWTILAMWDRSIDRRFNSNAAFIARGCWTADEMWRHAQADYPDVVRRLRAAPAEMRGQS